MTKIKAIETRYQGCLFRSRLEARWAVFFDSAGIPWRYEPEGFDLDGEWYLPDFWLPDQDLWVEIKPIEPTPRECRLASLLSVAGKPVLLLAGDCWSRQYQLHIFCSDFEVPLPSDTEFDQSEINEGPHHIFHGPSTYLQLRRCRRCTAFCYVEFWLEGDEEVFQGWGDIGAHSCGDHDRMPLDFDIKHFETARSARF